MSWTEDDAYANGPVSPWYVVGLVLLAVALWLMAGGAHAQTTTTFTDRLVLADPPAKSSETACLWRDASTGMVAAGACPTGTVSSVALTMPGIFGVSGSPITTSGTLAVSLANQNANLVFAGPTSGGAAAPTFRSLVKADHPAAVVFDDDANTFSAAGTALTVTNNAAFGGIASSLVPSLTDTFNLGSSLRLWNEGFLSQLNSVIYAEQTATLFGGWSVIGKNAGTFAAAVGAADTSINFGKAMTNGHFIVVRAHDTSGTVRTEHMQITGTTGCTTCTVTRGLNTGGTGYAFAQGTSYLVSGTTGDGRIELRAYSTPQISILTQGETYNAATEHVRIGYLDGAAGMGATTGKVGIVIGDASQYLRYYDGTLTIAGNGSGITSIHGGNIQTDTITATQIAANAITASEIAADAVTAAKIAATAIDGKTITGATIRTAASGARVEMNSSSLRSIDSNNNTLVQLDGTGIQVNQSETGSIDLNRGYRFALNNGVFGYRDTNSTKGYVVTRAAHYANNRADMMASSSSGASGGIYADTSGMSVTTRVFASPYGGTGRIELHGTEIGTYFGLFPGYATGSYQNTYQLYRSSTIATGLAINGDLELMGMYKTGGAWVANGGTTTLCDNGGWIYRCNASSRRYKTHIVPAPLDRRVLDLQPVRFDYREPNPVTGEPLPRSLGLIAEDVDALGLRDLVTYQDGQPEAVQYDKLALYLLEVIKDQQRRIEALEAKLKE